MNQLHGSYKKLSEKIITKTCIKSVWYLYISEKVQ